jgi:hypothetical protein
MRNFGTWTLLYCMSTVLPEFVTENVTYQTRNIPSGEEMLQTMQVYQNIVLYTVQLILDS